MNRLSVCIDDRAIKSVFCFICLFARPELAEPQRVRRSVRLAAVGDVWLGELLPYGFSKRSWSKTEPGSQTITPTLTPTWVDRSDRQGRQSDFLFGDKAGK